MTIFDWAFIYYIVFFVAFMAVILGVVSFYWQGGIPGIVMAVMLPLLMAVAALRFRVYLPWYAYWLLLIGTAATAIIQYQMAKRLKPPKD
jgi:hypothetical protein